MRRTQSRDMRTKSGMELGSGLHRALSPSEMEGKARNRTCMAEGREQNTEQGHADEVRNGAGKWAA